MSKESPKMFDTINMDDVVKAGSLGYLYVTTDPPHPYGESRKDRNKKYVYLHRAVMEKHLGRYLEPEEQVDHKDKDKTNNSPNNLRLRNLGEHQKEHSLTNHFWKTSPLNKPHKKKKKASDLHDSAMRVVIAFLQHS
jgi:hypothetical protein